MIMDFYNRLQLNKSSLTDKQFKIAKSLYKLIKKENLGISLAAKKLETSTSTISKLIKKLGYTDYRSFVITTYNPEEETNNGESLIKIKDYYNELINKSLELLDEETIQEVIDQIESSNRITVIGVGNSGISAEELSSRLERMGYSVKAITDVHRMKMQSTLLNEDDLLIAISNSGETISVNDSAKIAEKQGATILSITNNNQSDLYQNSTKSIILSSFRNVDDEKFINSQVPIIYFFDVLCYELLKIKSRKENRDKTLQIIVKGSNT